MLKAMVGGKLAMILVGFVSIPTAWGFVAFLRPTPGFEGGDSASGPGVARLLWRTQLPHLVRSLIMAGVLAALMSKPGLGPSTPWGA